MSHKVLNSQTFQAARRKAARAAKRPRPSLTIPLHLDPKDQSMDADRARYDHNIAMREINPQGFRVIGKRGVTRNRLSDLAVRGYNLSHA